MLYDNPKVNHWVATKDVLCYVKSTSNYGLIYSRTHDFRFSGFKNSDWAGLIGGRTSAFGCVCLGSDAIT